MRRAVSVSVVIKIEHKVPLIAHTKVFVSMKQVCRAVSVLHALSSKTCALGIHFGAIHSTVHSFLMTTLADTALRTQVNHSHTHHFTKQSLNTVLKS